MSSLLSRKCSSHKWALLLHYSCKDIKHNITGHSLCSKNHSLANSFGIVMLIHACACDHEAYGYNDPHQHHPQQHGNVANKVCHHCPPDPAKGRTLQVSVYRYRCHIYDSRCGQNYPDDRYNDVHESKQGNEPKPSRDEVTSS